MIKRIIGVAALSLLVTATQAQSTHTTSGGLMIDKDIMMPSEVMGLSRNNFALSTARSMAMGGAFTSLGADLSSMSINPAGIGMYRSGALTITPMISSTQASTPSTMSYVDNSATRFSTGNFGMVFNTYEDSKPTIVNFAVGYNRLADLNYNYSFASPDNGSSIADVFSKQLDWRGVNVNDFYSGGNWNWGRVGTMDFLNALGYRAGMVDQTNDGWRPTWIGNSASIDHQVGVESRGSIGEFAFTMAANFSNKFYLGATFGIHNVKQELNYYYSEQYYYDQASTAHGHGTDPSLEYQMLYSNINQTSIVSGAGVNLKIGAIYRPTKALRLGFAFHTPTVYTVSRTYQAAIETETFANNHNPNSGVTPDANGFIYVNEVSPLIEDIGEYAWTYSTPPRLLFGASYAFGNRAIVSLDYQRDWYNGIRIGDGVHKEVFQNDLKGANTLRLGAEYKLTPQIAVRAGGGYSGSMFHSDDYIMPSPTIKSNNYYTAGLGFAVTPMISIDLAYMYSVSQTTDYYSFYFEEYTPTSETYSTSALYSTKFKQHTASLGITFKL